MDVLRYLSACKGNAITNISTGIIPGGVQMDDNSIKKGNTDEECITALIEVKISPQLGDGYDRIAQRIYQYDVVDSLFLMTGSYDLLVTMTVKTLNEAAVFVYEHLAAIEGVTSTATRFIMKKYKENGKVFVKTDEQKGGGFFI